jgi:hypothetical protein
MEVGFRRSVSEGDILVSRFWKRDFVGFHSACRAGKRYFLPALVFARLFARSPRTRSLVCLNPRGIGAFAVSYVSAHKAYSPYSELATKDDRDAGYRAHPGGGNGTARPQ